MSFTRHLLVDGANILHAWPELRGLLRRDRDAARSQLVRRVGAIHDGEQVRVTVVFDGRGEELVIERPSAQPTFSVLHTPSSLTADDVIEQLVAKAADPSACVVATGDHGERETVSAAGAQVVTPEDLEAWVGRAEARQSTRVGELQRANKRKWRK
ncbi:MAG TPA: NYN domain-containing protein [Opitutaceae bacterium]|nr:NYN domain-containing protein [Opitutaceae bacterium]